MERLENNGSLVNLFMQAKFLTCLFRWQDSTKINDLTKECDDSTNLIPKLQEDIPKLQKVLSDEEKTLEEIKEKSKGVNIIMYYSLNTVREYKKKL